MGVSFGCFICFVASHVSSHWKLTLQNLHRPTASRLRWKLWIFFANLLPICQIFRHKTLFLNGFGMDLILLWSLALRAQLSAGPPGGTVEGHDRSGPTSALMACQVCAGRNDARHDWATSWLISPCVLRRLLWTCRAPLFCLSNRRTSVRRDGAQTFLYVAATPVP